MNEALMLSGYKTKKETVEEVLRLLIALKSQARVRKYRGKLEWDGDLDKIRADKLNKKNLAIIPDLVD